MIITKLFFHLYDDNVIACQYSIIMSFRIITANTPIDKNSVITRNLKWQENETGLVVVFKPCLGNNRIGKRIAEIFAFDDYRIRLDCLGSAVWKLCNGTTSLDRIHTRLVESFPEQDKDTLEERLVAFLHQMNRSRMITIFSPGNE